VIPEEAIEKAKAHGWMSGYDFKGIQEGGLYLFSWNEEPHTVEEWRDFSVLLCCLEKIALDPSFWRCLGQALDWTVTPPEPFSSFRYAIWQQKAHNFYDLMLTGEDTGTFWSRVLKESQ
jgi:hypothetical protein